MTKTVLGGIAALVLFIALMIGLNWVGLFAARPMAKYQTETSRQVYDTSRAYQDGTKKDLARYCRDYAEAPEGSKRAIADLIRTTKDTYTGPLTPANQACLSEIGE